jgi:hypothetical protein
MFIPDPDFTRSGSRISDPKTATKETGEKKLVVKPFFVTTNFTKVKYFFFNAEKKNIWASFQRIIELLPQNLSPSSKIYGDPQHCLKNGEIQIL